MVPNHSVLSDFYPAINRSVLLSRHCKHIISYERKSRTRVAACV